MLSSGLSLGKEGPFIHIAGCIAESLPYAEKDFNKKLRHQFLTAAVAVGVSATFGAPIGGVLFAIENIPGAFVARLSFLSFLFSFFFYFIFYIFFFSF